MKVTNVSGANQVKQVITNEASRTAKMVAAFNKGGIQPSPAQGQPQAQTEAVANPNQVSPEEMSAIIPPSIPAPNIDASPSNEEPAQQEEPKAEPKEVKEDTTSAQFQLLARKERQLRAKAQQDQQAIKAEREKMAQDKAALEARVKELESSTISRQRLKEQAYQVLEEEGVSYDDLTQQALNAQNNNPRYDAYINKLQSKIAELENKFTNAEKQQVEAQESQYKAALRQIETDVRDLVKNSPEEYELIAKTQSIRDVRDLIESTFKEGFLKQDARHDKDWEYAPGEVMPSDVAAQIVEDHLTEEAWKLSQSKKIKKRLSPAPAEQKRTDMQTPKQTVQPQPMKTLTNATSSTRKLSVKERAILAFKGELK